MKFVMYQWDKFVHQSSQYQFGRSIFVNSDWSKTESSRLNFIGIFEESQ